MDIIFYLLLFLMVYIYLGYPVIILVLSHLFGFKAESRNGYLPSITLIIAAYNEERAIENKLADAIRLDYPKEKLQIIVASDASTDRTDTIVKSYESSGVALFSQENRKGKSEALNYVVSNLAKGELLVFTDATAVIAQDALANIAKYFSDPRVGAICANLYYPLAHAESMYWRFERWLRNKEGKMGALPFVSGAFYAMRKTLYCSTPAGMPDDSFSPLSVLGARRKVVFAADVIAQENPPQSDKDLFSCKVRGIVRELNSVFYYSRLLNIFRHPLVAFVLISHRLTRYASPFFLISFYLVCLLLIYSGSIIIIMFFVLQTIFYLLVLAHIITGSRIKSWLFIIPHHFCLVNYAAFIGVLQYISGRRYLIWEPIR